MTEFAQDVIDAGIKIVGTSENSKYELRIVCEAITYERERCAKIAEENSDEAPEWTYHIYDGGGTRDGWQMASSAIAKSIRGQD